MFSGKSYENAKRVNLFYWHLNLYVFDRLCDNEWQGPDALFAKHVIASPWWDWAKEREFEIHMEMIHVVMDQTYVYIAYTNMPPQDETFFRLKYEVLHKHDMT